MQVFVRCLDEERCYTVGSASTLESLLNEVRAANGIDFDLQLYSGECLVSAADELINEANYTAMVALVGGKKKSGKKKKVYSTPKKNKHKHKNTKLHVLEYYALDAKDGNVEKVRKICKSETCKDRGIFLASHANRYYCGKCHATFQRTGPVKEEKKRAPAAAIKKEDDKKKEAVVDKKKGKKK